MTQPIDGDHPWDAFISYSSQDRPWVDDFVRRLKERGVRVWYDIERIDWGAPVRLSIVEGVVSSRHVILVMTPSSVGTRDRGGSAWVGLEHLVAGHLDPANTARRLLPLKLIDCEVPLDLKPLHAIDLTEDGALDRELDRIVDALRAAPGQGEAAPDAPPGRDDRLRGILDQLDAFYPLGDLPRAVRILEAAEAEGAPLDPALVAEVDTLLEELIKLDDWSQVVWLLRERRDYAPCLRRRMERLPPSQWLIGAMMLLAGGHPIPRRAPDGEAEPLPGWEPATAMIHALDGEPEALRSALDGAALTFRGERAWRREDAPRCQIEGRWPMPGGPPGAWLSIDLPTLLTDGGHDTGGGAFPTQGRDHKGGLMRLSDGRRAVLRLPFELIHAGERLWPRRLDP